MAMSVVVGLCASLVAGCGGDDAQGDSSGNGGRTTTAVIAAVRAPAVDPVVAFPTERVWQEPWLPIDNPERADIPETQLVDRWVDAHPGDEIADIGAGGGYYTFRYAARVGASGHVHAVDRDWRVASKIAFEARRRHVENVTVVQVQTGDLNLAPRAYDVTLLLSTGALSACSPTLRRGYVEQIAESLREGGRFVYVDAVEWIPTGDPREACASPTADEVIALAQPYFDVVERVDTDNHSGPDSTALLFRRRASTP